MNFPAQKTPQTRRADPMTHEEALEIIARAQQDSYLARELDYLRDKCCLFLQDVIHDVNLALAEKEKKVPALLRSKVDSAISLRMAAQQREELARQRRELAEAMVIGALLNIDNPDWDPIQGSARGHGKGGLLMALLKTSDGWQA